MNRSKLGGLGMGRVAALACASALGIAGCGGSSSSSSTSTASHLSSQAASQFDPVLLNLDVTGDAYAAAVWAPQPNLPTEQKAIATMRDTVYNADIAVRKMKVPAGAQSAFLAYLLQSKQVVAALDQLYKETSVKAIISRLNPTLAPRLTKFLNAETQLRSSLGMPKRDPWFKAQPIGPTIYTDSMSAPHGKIKWALGSNVRYAGGGLDVSAAPNRNGVTGPTTPYTFDGQHISVQVDATPVKGDPYIGIACPPMVGDVGFHLIGQIGPGAQWSIGALHLNAPGQLLRAATPTRAVKVGQTNHLRVDCDQWRPGLTTVRLYVNGQYLGDASDAVSVSPSYEAGIAIVNTSSTPSAVKFTNWQVSKLGH